MSHPFAEIQSYNPALVAVSELQGTPSLWFPRTRLRWLESCLEVLLPAHCLICRRALRGTSVCYRCRPRLPDIADLCARNCQICFSPVEESSTTQVCDTCYLFPPLTDSIRFLWEYDGLARDFIRTMKYRPSMSLAHLGGKLLAGSAVELFSAPSASTTFPAISRWDVIVPIPSSRSMLQKRLFHPCSELALPLSNHLKIPLRHALTHDGKRAPQASLSHQQRLRGLQRLFRVDRRYNAAEKRILLVEDVITTGATISAAAFTLKKAGARRVDVLSLARTSVWGRFRGTLHEFFQPAGTRNVG